jgi:hypothetical protein
MDPDFRQDDDDGAIWWAIALGGVCHVLALSLARP